MIPDSHNPNTETSLLTNTAENLRTAIANIEEFSRQNLQVPYPSFYALDLRGNRIVTTQNSPLKRTITLIKSLLPFFADKQSKQRHSEKSLLIQQQLMRSIDIIKNHYLLIDRFRKGTPSQKQLAESALEAIERYNVIISQANATTPSLSGQFAKFLLKRAGWLADDELRHHRIELPTVISVTKQSSYGSGTIKAAKIAAQTTSLSAKPIKGEIDTFRMKAITMILKHASPSLKEVMSHVRNTPIKVTNICENSSSPIISLKQKLIPFPGEIIEVKGAFQRKISPDIRSIPLLDSFTVYSKSTQTGFPHPCQHTAWALTDVLIPTYPHRPHLLPTLSSLCQRKQQLAYQLLPHGSLINKAKDLLHLKSQIFDAESSKYLALHQQLILTLLQCCSKEEKDFSAITSFYANIKDLAAPYSYLSTTHQKCLDFFIVKPFFALQQAWLEHRIPQLYNENHEERLMAVRSILDGERKKASRDLEEQHLTAQTPLEHASLDYITIVGPTLAAISQSLIVQQFSEKIEYPPPALSDVERKIQKLLYQQQLNFLEELDHNQESLPLMEKHLENLFHTEMNLLRHDDSHQEVIKIVQELENYYNIRHKQINNT